MSERIARVHSLDQVQIDVVGKSAVTIPAWLIVDLYDVVKYASEQGADLTLSLREDAIMDLATRIGR